LERRSFDYSGIDAAMALADEAMRKARRIFATLAPRVPADNGSAAVGAGGNRRSAADFPD
jgi:hypothetical protein